VFVYDKESFALENTLSITGEGWGLTHDETHLIISDGSNTLRYLDPETLEEVKSVTVTDGGTGVDRLTRNWLITCHQNYVNPYLQRLNTHIKVRGLSDALIAANSPKQSKS
jgi:glutamine cyclotransferase